MTTEEWAGEDILTEALAEIVKKCDELQIDLLLIGAFAVRAYAQRRRLTTDLDFVAPRAAQSGLATAFKALGYQYSSHTRFQGVQAVKHVGGARVQVDVAIDTILDQNTGRACPIPVESFRQKTKVTIMPLQGGSGVEAYALPLADLLLSKLVPSREQDAADVVALVLGSLPTDTIIQFKGRARDAGLMDFVNERLGQLVSLSDRALQEMMRGHTGGQLTKQEIGRLRRGLRELRISPRTNMI